LAKPHDAPGGPIRDHLMVREFEQILDELRCRADMAAVEGHDP
jgi:hypothetical protein